jgi:hypothetical protein
LSSHLFQLILDVPPELFLLFCANRNDERKNGCHGIKMSYYASENASKRKKTYKCNYNHFSIDSTMFILSNMLHIWLYKNHWNLFVDKKNIKETFIISQKKNYRRFIHCLRCHNRAAACAQQLKLRLPAVQVQYE